MAGDLITCPLCQGWTPDETGMTCDLCGGDGVVWEDWPADDDLEEGFDAGEWTETPKVVNVGDELHQILADALNKK